MESRWRERERGETKERDRESDGGRESAKRKSTGVKERARATVTPTPAAKLGSTFWRTCTHRTFPVLSTSLLLLLFSRFFYSLLFLSLSLSLSLSRREEPTYSPEERCVVGMHIGTFRLVATNDDLLKRLIAKRREAITFHRTFPSSSC